MSEYLIKDPTTRKVLNRGWKPIRYRLAVGKNYDEVRHGWVVSEDEKFIVVQLIGEERVRNLPVSEGRYIRDTRECYA